MVSIRKPLQLLPPIFPYPVFTRCVCFYYKCFINHLFQLLRLLRNISHFQIKKKLFLSTFCWSVLILLISMCFDGLFVYSNVIIKIRINNILYAWLQIWHLMKSYDVIKEFTVWKLQATSVFLVSEGTKLEVDTSSIVLSYLYHFRNVKKELFR